MVVEGSVVVADCPVCGHARGFHERGMCIYQRDGNVCPCKAVLVEPIGVSQPAGWIDDILTVTAKHGLIPAEIRLADGTHLLLAPKDAPLPPEDPKAPKEMPENFDDLPLPEGLPPNWKDPRDGRDTEDSRKRADAEQSAADRLVFGEAIPEEK